MAISLKGNKWDLSALTEEEARQMMILGMMFWSALHTRFRLASEDGDIGAEISTEGEDMKEFLANLPSDHFYKT